MGEPRNETPKDVVDGHQLRWCCEIMSGPNFKEEWVDKREWEVARRYTANGDWAGDGEGVEADWDIDNSPSATKSLPSTPDHRECQMVILQRWRCVEAREGGLVTNKVL